MGSIGFFALLHCVRCDGSYMPEFPVCEICPSCDIALGRRLTIDNLQQLPVVARDEIAAFAGRSRLRGYRRFFLHQVLLSRGSVFRKLTFLSYGLLGNVSETEDLLDRVMSFV